MMTQPAPPHGGRIVSINASPGGVPKRSRPEALVTVSDVDGVGLPGRRAAGRARPLACDDVHGALRRNPGVVSRGRRLAHILTPDPTPLDRLRSWSAIPRRFFG